MITSFKKSFQFSHRLICFGCHVVRDDAINTDYESFSAPYKSTSFPVSTFLHHPSGSCQAVREAVCRPHHTVLAVQRVGNEKSERGLTMLLLQHLLPARASRDLPHRFFFSLKMITVNVATNNNVKHFDSQVSHETLNLKGPYAPLC